MTAIADRKLDFSTIYRALTLPKAKRAGPHDDYGTVKAANPPLLVLSQGMRNSLRQAALEAQAQARAEDRRRLYGRIARMALLDHLKPGQVKDIEDAGLGRLLVRMP
jgi:hypothetical protein